MSDVFSPDLINAINTSGSSGTAPSANQNTFDDSMINAVGSNPAPAPIATPPAQPESKLASFGAGLGKGFGDTALGIQQLAGKGLQAASNILPDSIGSTVNKAGQWLSNDAETGIKNLSSENQPYAASNPKTNTAGQFGGTVASAAALPIGDVGEGANLINKLIYATKAGGIIGASQPVNNPDANFWSQKVLQTGAGAAGGAIGYPVGAVAGKVLGSAGNKLLNAVRNGVSSLSGKDAAEAVAGASPELQSAVKAAAAKGENLNPAALSRQVEADSLPVKISLTSGQATQDPVQISMERNMRAKNLDMAYKYNDQNSQLIGNIDSIKKNAAPDVAVPDNFTAGQNLIDSIQGKIDQNKAATQAAYKALTDANGGQIPIDGKSFAANANQALGQNMKGAFLPPQIQGILQKFQTGEQPMNFENFENLRTILGASARGATDGNVEGAVNTVRNTLENMPMDGQAGQLKGLADTARAAAKQGFDLERSVPAYKAVASGKVSPDDFVKKFIINGKSGDIQGMAGILHDDPAALQNIKASVVNHLKDKSVNQAGNFSQNDYNNALDALKPKLGIIFSPEEQATMQTLGKVATNVQSQPTGSFVNNSNTDVSNLARSAGGVAAGAVDTLTHSPIGSMAHNVISSAIDKKASSNTLRSILQPGAGISSPGEVTNLLKNKLPNVTGKMGLVPLSALLSNNASGSQK